MRRNTGYISKRNQYRSNQKSAHDFARALTLDGVVIALGQLGCDADFLHNFKNEYIKVESEIIVDVMKPDCDSIMTNSRKDKIADELNYAHTKKFIDEIILQYIHPEDYLAFDYRYGLKEISKDEHISR